MKGLVTILAWLIVFPLAGQPANPLPPGPGGVSDLGSLTNGLPLSLETRALIEQLQFDIEQLHPLLALANGGAGIANNAPPPDGLVPYLFPEPPPAHPVPNFGKLLAGNFSQNYSVNLGKNLSTLTSVTPPGTTALLPANANEPLAPFPIAAPVPPPNPAPATPPASPNRLGQNEVILLQQLEMVLQDAEANLQQLLPRLDRLASGAAVASNAGGAASASTYQFAGGSAGVGSPGASGLASPLSGQFAQPLRNGFTQPSTNGTGHPPGSPHPSP